MIVERFGRRLVQEFSGEQRQLVSVLNNSRDTNSAAPVVIKMRLLVGHHLQLIRLEAVCVEDDVVAGWSNCSLSNTLADEEEVVTENETVVNVIEIRSLCKLTVPATLSCCQRLFPTLDSSPRFCHSGRFSCSVAC